MNSIPKIPEIVIEPEDSDTDFSKIRCPLCHWHPKVSSRWLCADCPSPENYPNGCGNIWNTFDTRGFCLGCGHQWRWTACLKCYGYSLHEDWYL